MPGRVFILEDHPLMRETTSEFVSALPGVEVCGTAASAEEALAALPEANADLLLVDVSLPGMSGIEFVKEALTRWPAMRCLMFSGHTESLYVERALDAGACGYVTKGNPAALSNAVLSALSGDEYVSDAARVRPVAEGT